MNTAAEAPTIPELSFQIHGRWHPGYALIGRLVRRRSASAWHAGGRLIVVLGLLATALLLLTIAAWTLAGAYGLLVSLLAWALFAVAALVGFQPPVSIDVQQEQIVLRQGKRRRTLVWSEIDDMEVIDPLTYHRRHRRDTVTDRWVNVPTHAALLLKTTSGPLVLGLHPEDHSPFLAHFQTRHAAYS